MVSFIRLENSPPPAPLAKQLFKYFHTPAPGNLSLSLSFPERTAHSSSGFLLFRNFELQNIPIQTQQHLLARAPRAPLAGLLLGLLRAARDGLGDLLLGLLGLGLGLLSVGLDLVLGGSRGGAAAEEADEDEEEGDDADGDAGGDLGDELDGLDGVALGDGGEQVDLLLGVGDGVVHEGHVERGLGLVSLVFFGLLGLLLLLFDGLLDVEGGLREGLGIGDGVADVDVVEEDVVLHGPDFEADL